MDEEVYIECTHCEMKYTIILTSVYDEEVGEEDIIFPEYCCYCKKPIEIG